MEPPTETLTVQTHTIVEALRLLAIGNGKFRIGLANELGLSYPELNALIHIGDANDLTPKQVSKLLDITTGSVTAMSDRLEAAGFLIRRPNPSDRRSLLLHLTPAGDHAMRWVYEQFDKAVADVVGSSTALPVQVLADYLERIAQALNEAATAIELDASKRS